MCYVVPWSTWQIKPKILENKKWTLFLLPAISMFSFVFVYFCFFHCFNGLAVYSVCLKRVSMKRRSENALYLQSGKFESFVLLGPVPRKMVKFNPGLSQISNTVFLSKSVQLEVTKYCWALLRDTVMITQNVTLNNA